MPTCCRTTVDVAIAMAATKALAHERRWHMARRCIYLALTVVLVGLLHGCTGPKSKEPMDEARAGRAILVIRGQRLEDIWGSKYSWR